MPIYKSVDKSFFKKWTKDVAYILGFFSADGYMTTNNRGAEFLCFEITDRKLLETIKQTLASEHKITRRRSFGKNTYRLQIGSIEMCSDLRKLGLREGKTKNLQMPDVPVNLVNDFVRGYFDGDGNIWHGEIHKDRKRSMMVIRVVFTSCSKGFLESLKSKLADFNVEKGVISKGKGQYYRLTYSVVNSLKLYDFMYNTLGTSKLFLQRKKGVFERFIKMRS